MFRKTLLATTALVLGASLAFAAHEQGKPSSRMAGHVIKQASMLVNVTKHQGVVHNTGLHTPKSAIFSDFGKDANAEFVSWYGFSAYNFSSTYYISHSYHDAFTEVGFNATPFTGTGKAAANAEVPGFGYASTYTFEVQILSDSGGLPGANVATTSSFSWPDTSLCCTSVVTVNFTGKSPKLTKGATYFAAVSANPGSEGGWNMENIDFSGATVDYWHVKVYETYNFDYGQTYTYSYSSPWHASTEIPSAGAIVINK